jgi:hypothetical protein
MVSDIIEEAGEVLFQLIVETLFFSTGDVALYVFTLRRRKPRWDFYLDEPPVKYVVLSELNVWIGGLIWIFGIGIIAWSLLGT